MYSILSQELQNFATSKIASKTKHVVNINELLLIQQQSDLISQLTKTPIFAGKSSRLSTGVSDQSFECIKHLCCINHSSSAIQFGRQYSQYFQDNIGLNKQALGQVKRLCSEKTYQFIRDKFLNFSEHKGQSRLQRQIKYNKELLKKCLKLQIQIVQLKSKLETATQKLNSQRRQKIKNSNPSINIDRGETLLKWQKSLLYKQKIQAQIKKNLNKQFSLLKVQQQQNCQLRLHLQNILFIIEQKVYDKELHKSINILSQIIQKQRKLEQKQENEFHRAQKNIQQIIAQLNKGISSNI